MRASFHQKSQCGLGRAFLYLSIYLSLFYEKSTCATLWRYSLPHAARKMAFEVATATLENKAGEKVAASEALKGKVIALYVRLALPRTAPWRECRCDSGVITCAPAEVLPLGCRQFSAHWCPPCRGAQHALAIRGGAVLYARLS